MAKDKQIRNVFYDRIRRYLGIFDVYLIFNILLWIGIFIMLFLVVLYVTISPDNVNLDTVKYGNSIWSTIQVGFFDIQVDSYYSIKSKEIYNHTYVLLIISAIMFGIGLFVNKKPDARSLFFEFRSQKKGLTFKEKGYFETFDKVEDEYSRHKNGEYTFYYDVLFNEEYDYMTESQLKEYDNIFADFEKYCADNELIHECKFDKIPYVIDKKITTKNSFLRDIFKNHHIRQNNYMRNNNISKVEMTLQITVGSPYLFKQTLKGAVESKLAPFKIIPSKKNNFLRKRYHTSEGNVHFLDEGD